MIKVRTIDVRQALDRCIYILIMLLIILLLLLVIILGLHIFQTNYFTKNINLFSKDISSDNIVVSALKNELPLMCWNIKKTESEIAVPVFAEKEKIEVNVNEVDKVNYDLPKNYDVCTLENGKIQVGNMRLTNYSKLPLNQTELSKPVNNRVFDNSDFLIFHTHATECYSDLKDKVTNYRTTDTEYNVVSVGTTLKEELEVKGYKAIHDDTLHDYPNYNGSYQQSLNTTQKYLKSHDYDFVIDVHRDALGSDLSYAPVVNINGKDAAMLMFVIGTDACGLSHDKWMENLKLAIMIQNRANEMYPGLFRDLNLSSSRYNQHVSSGSFIIEVGATGNNLEEAKYAMKLFANVIDSFK